MNRTFGSLTLKEIICLQITRAAVKRVVENRQIIFCSKVFQLYTAAQIALTRLQWCTGTKFG